MIRVNLIMLFWSMVLFVIGTTSWQNGHTTGLLGLALSAYCFIKSFNARPPSGV